MDIEFTSAEDASKTELRIKCGPYDGVPPVPSFFTEHRIHHVHPDRLAIAAVLLLKPYICGPLTLPRPCSPETARGLEAFLAPLDVKVMSVEHAPFAKPIGARAALLSPPALGVWNDLTVDHDLTFGFADTQKYQSQMGVDEIKVCCNLRALAPDDAISLTQGLLGLCILCAEDAMIDRIICPPHLVGAMENFEILARTAALSNIILGA